jgi:hypothetical protein
MKRKIKQLVPSAAIIDAMDSDTSVSLDGLENYKALATEVVSDKGQVEGTLLYVPGVSVRLLLGK